MRSIVRTLWLALYFLLPAVVFAQRRPNDIVVERGTIHDESGRTVPYEIGTLYVPENRGKPDSRLIGVGFARIRSPHPTGAPPVFWLPGGPGLSVLGAFTENDRGKLRTWLSLSEVADVVVLEQRGYTERGEKLLGKRPAYPLDKPGSVTADVAQMRALAAAAVAAHPGKDLSGYDIGEFAADVDSLRVALGYDKVTLFGGSFGSQWSLAVMRLHPRIVARAVLSSVEPLDGGYDMPSQVYASLQRMAYDADRDPGLKPYLPTGGVMGAIAALHDRFAKGPVSVTVKGEDGTVRNVVLGAEDLQRALLSHTQDGGQDGERWPRFILSLYHGHYEEWAKDTIEDRRAGDVILIGPLADSSLGVTAARELQLRSDPAVAMLGTWNFASNIASAPAWPTRDMGDAVREPIPNDIPVVFIHGDWDTSTPIDNTLGLLPYFRNGHAIVVHRGAHNGAMYQIRNEPRATRAVYDFLKTGATQDLPVAVVLPVPKFAVPDFPPPGG
ncbi:alpha/beta fold hydrolase [Luteibacter aegosomatis]|uniref:alpha/beta fold hydrolase n=1 Tax=Luteibacter aegosomatis TaxID=2911537 RepID=UPI001FFA4418|nr:alpha/beta fold hydrolase [Luteibacter aegosomatis]UPG83826.1 alpha/beta fold hydrolase [Luteibacter aegosomatis]